MSETQRTTSTVSRLSVLFSVRICLIVVSTCLQRNRAAIQSCAVSLESIKDDVQCPTNLTEWNIKAQEMRCASYSQRCTEASDFVYHCLVNAWGNGTTHVCAPTRTIHGKYCAEFSKGGARVQAHYLVNCTRCPKSYNSTKSYLYQECYENIITPTTTPTKMDLSSSISIGKNMTTAREKHKREETWNYEIITVAILIVTVVITGIPIVVIVWYYKRRKKSDYIKDSQLPLNPNLIKYLSKITKTGKGVLKRKFYESKFHEEYANYHVIPDIKKVPVTGSWEEDLGIQAAADTFNIKIYVVIHVGTCLRTQPAETKTICFLPMDIHTDKWMKVALEKEHRYRILSDCISSKEEEASLTYDDAFDVHQFQKEKNIKCVHEDAAV